MRISDWSSDVCSSDLSSQVPVPSHPSSDTASGVRTGLDNVTRRPFWSPHPARPRQFHELPSCAGLRSEEHTSELQSLMRISYAVFCLKKKTKHVNIRSIPIPCLHDDNTKLSIIRSTTRRKT